MAKKNIEKEMNQVSGGRVNVRERMAMYEKLNEPQMPLPKKGPTPGKIDIGERSIEFDVAKSNVANAKPRMVSQLLSQEDSLKCLELYGDLKFGASSYWGRHSKERFFV